MKFNEEQTAYYGQINEDGWSFYIAATDKGLCFVGSQEGAIDEVKKWFGKNRPKAELVEAWDSVALYADELVEYLNGERKDFDLPADLAGTEFQEAVWAELRNIPFGEIKTYTDIAKNIGRPKSVRAVGSAIGANPVMIVVPCHRVIAKSGKLAGFRGGIPMKERLLELEKK
ncbi:cysteine methyltransferase [Virgibacillus profundi]|uniref:Methylated-DNA--protein-cysteine methyltransferase n=1 Tax=Virgibacillus profundi TaxID=2024555 RepID=A0A2A2IHY2_9BACI|nr:methylated-DNA--[protein]-cysteine S-methyltransferase [Virgibacillus profundi]PAV31611.1 cysteine methyltransferase [Virgibacillus profundi]PXY55797.1 methylated-DNA--[protein]-cysteine S-methyltransferase [Virgibacillus profundi]